MSVSESTFRDYDLRAIAASEHGVNELAGGLIPEIADILGYEQLSRTPIHEELSGFVGHVGDAKELQHNIEAIAAKLSGYQNPLQMAGNWVLRADALRNLNRNFVVNEQIPQKIDHLVVTGGVARWMMRRAKRINDLLLRDRLRVGQLHIMTGKRPMSPAEGTQVEYVSRYFGYKDKQPTESDFATAWLVETFSSLAFGLDVRHTKVASQNGDEIFAEGIAENEQILDGTVMVIGNAPSTVMTTGQFLMQAVAQRPGFNSNHDQLFMSGDSYPLARTAEQAGDPAGYQNPYSALGQIARNAMLLHRAAQAIKAGKEA